MWRIGSNRRLIGLGGLMSYSWTHSLACAEDNASATEKSTAVRLYLTAASKERLHEYMQTIGAPNFSADYVVMKDHATREDCLEYDSKGVLGHRVGFRLKGIAFGDGFISGSGKLSIMEGELKHSQFEASLPLLSTQNAITPPMLQAATCVPTMIRNHRGDMTKPFMGTVPGNDVSRAPIEVKFFPVNKDSELLLGGVCCTEECWGDSGCDFEKIQQQLQNLPPSPSSNLTILPPEYATQPNENTACVVCRWLEAGPCAAEYKAWNEAMEIYTKEKDNDGRVFYSTANAMSACVRKYEYYDVYVAFL